MTDNDHEAAVQCILRRVEHLLDRFLCNYCREEKEDVWDKGSFEETSGWWPHVTGCSECKYLADLLERAKEGLVSLY